MLQGVRHAGQKFSHFPTLLTNDTTIERLRQQARVSVKEGKLEKVEITPDALKAYLDRKFGSDGRMTTFSYEWTVKVLRKLGFTNFQQIDKCISGYDDDHISRLLVGTRQGQVARFELLLLAGMDDYYIKAHPWVDEEWWISRQKKYVGILKGNGVKVGEYRPSQESISN